jgi:hypothetical protein
MYHHASQLCYASIPKNASSFLRENLINHNWQHTSIDSIASIKNIFIVLRDPIDRWLTGIAQHITTNILGENFGSTHYLELDNELVNRIIFDQIVFDDHTEQQSWFIESFNTDKAVFFYLDSNLSKNLDHYFRTFGFEYNLESKSHVNESKNNFDNNNLVEHFKKLIYSNNNYLTQLKSFFSKDYDLISSIEFYESR